MTSYMYGLLDEVRSDTSLELTSLKLVDLKKRALICDTFIRFGEGPVWAHPKGLNVGFGAGHVEFIRIDQDIIDLSEQLDIMDVNIDKSDLFTAAMFELFRGRKDVMEDCLERWFEGK